MKLRYLWKITLDNEWKQGIRSFFNVILYIVGITIIGLLVYFVSLETDTKKSVERSIRKEIKTLGSISIEGNPSDIQYNSNFNLLKVVKSFSGIDACSSGWGNGSLAISGDWRIEYDASEYRDEDLKLLQDIQKKNVYDPGYAIQGKSLETTWLDAGAWDTAQPTYHHGPGVRYAHARTAGPRKPSPGDGRPQLAITARG